MKLKKNNGKIISGKNKMCGVIGYSNYNATENDFELIEKLFIQSEIRGKHATGISWINGENKIQTVREPVGAKEFLKKFDITQVLNKGTISLIGHIRYSTSDLRYNQPFSNDKYAIVHNGVISQDSPDKWPIKCETGNDSEMILRCLSNQNIYNHPLLEFPDSSQAVVYLTNTGFVGGFRNGQRPLWITHDKYFCVFTSTENIALRSGLKNPSKTEQFVDYMHFEDQIFIQDFPTNNKKDLQ